MTEDKSLKKIIAKAEYKKGKAYLSQLESRSKSSYSNIRIAASVLLVLGLTIGVFLMLNSKDQVHSEDLFVEYFEPYQNIIAPITRDSSKDNLNGLERAFFNYENQQYELALRSFDSLLMYSDFDKSTLRFYKANTLLKLNQDLSECIKIFEQNINESDQWKDKNLWYLSLAYLKSNEQDKAIETLNRLKKLDSNFKNTKQLRLSKALE